MQSRALNPGFQDKLSQPSSFFDSTLIKITQYFILCFICNDTAESTHDSTPYRITKSPHHPTSAQS